jgi:hypothetical protein
MIRHTVDEDQLLLFVLNNAGYIFVQFFFVLFGNEILPSLHCEDDVDVDLRIALAINIALLSELKTTPSFSKNFVIQEYRTRYLFAVRSVRFFGLRL